MRILPLLLVCSVLAAAEIVPEAVDAVAQHSSELTIQHQQFLDWSLVEAFRRAGGQQPWRAEAEKFLGDLGRQLSLEDEDAHILAHIRAGRALLAAGCDDPLVRLRVGMLLGGSAEGPTLVAGSIEPLRARMGTPEAYPGIQLVSALRRQIDPRTRKLTADRARELSVVIVAASREAMAAPCGRAIAIDRLVEWLKPVFEEGILGKDETNRTIAALETSGGDAVLCGVLRGRASIRAAWDARGSGWANSVTEDGWKGFRSGLAEARRSLTAAWQACPDSATAASLMIVVTMGDSSGEEQLWFDRAVTADPGCPDAWKCMTNALMPRWGGSTKLLLALAQRAVAHARPSNRLGQAAGGVLRTFVEEGGEEAVAWKQIAILDARCPPEPNAVRIFRAMGVAWYAGLHDQAQELYAQNGGIATPVEVFNGAPFGRIRAIRLLSTLEHAGLGQATPVVRPIPMDGSDHRHAQHAPGFWEMLPGWWNTHGQHDPVWNARIRALLEKRPINIDLAMELFTAGCVDPVVHYIAIHDNSKLPIAERRAQLLACWNEFEAAGYPPVVCWQPAWFLMGDLYAGKDKTEVSRLTPRYLALAAKLALSVGVEGTTAGTIMSELGEPPGNDLELLDMIDQAAATPGVESALALGLTGLTALARAQRCDSENPECARLAWTAIARLWPAWNAYGHPKAAEAMSTAASLAGLFQEARWWFDEAIRLDYDTNRPWHSLSDGYAQTGRPDLLLAFASELSALPAASGATLQTFDPVQRVLSNLGLHEPELLKSAWVAIDRATTTILANPTISAEERRSLRYWRVTCAALVGDQPALTAAVKELKEPFDIKWLPRGIDPTKIEASVSAIAPAAPVNPSDF